MSSFQDRLELWLARKAAGSEVNVCFELPVVLATDIGKRRNENQDRLAAIRIGSKSSAGKPMIGVAVADGMGGMREGAKSAELAISHFFFGLVQQRASGTELRIRNAVLRANSRIFDRLGGNGGATLSAVILDHHERTWIVNIGDSRIYAIGSNKQLDRLTVDDSLEEAVGGHGRELLQFVGMGEGIQPHLREIDRNAESLFITTDGAHNIEPGVLERIIQNASGHAEAARRIMQISLWCGGADNASIATLDRRELSSALNNPDVEGIQVWDPHGALNIIWIRDTLAAPEESERVSVPDPANQPPTQQEETRPEAGKRSTSRARKKGPKLSEKDKVQIEINLEESSDKSDVSK